MWEGSLIDSFLAVMYSLNMEIYIIRASNPLDMEGSPDVAAVFIDEELAEEAAELLNKEQEAECRRTWKDRWRSFAIRYETEAHPVQTSLESVVAYLKEDWYERPVPTSSRQIIKLSREAPQIDYSSGGFPT